MAQKAARGPSTPEERAKALTYADDLEKNPLGPQASDERRWLTTWLIEVPDIHVSVCVNVFAKLEKGDKKQSNAIFGQLLYSSAAFILRNPDKASDIDATYLAGVEGALKVYEEIVQANPKDRQRSLDELIELRDSGKLADYVKQKANSECKQQLPN
jgi:carboxypeptidase Q